MSSESVNKMDKNYIALIRNKCPYNDLILTVVDLTTQKHVSSLYEYIRTNDIKQFLKDIPLKFGKGFKAIIISVSTFDSPQFSNNLEFRQAIQSQLELTSVTYQFINDEAYIFILPIYAANVTAKIDETIIVATLMDSTLQAINITQTTYGYKPSNCRFIPINLNDNGKKLRTQITGNCNPKEMIIMVGRDDKTQLEILKKKLPSANFLVLEDITHREAPLIIDYFKWMNDKSSVRTLMIPAVNQQYFIYKTFGGEIEIEEEDVIASSEELPFKKILTLPKTHCQYVVASIDQINCTKLPLIELTQSGNRHGDKVTFEIDINNFPTCSVQGIQIIQINSLPRTLDKMVKSKIPVIGFFGNLSVICVCKDDKKYEFLDTRGGSNGSELYISFDEEQPKFFDAALAMIKTKPNFVVYDFLKLLSLAPNKTIVDNTWPFKIIKDFENPILIEFDNFDGLKSAASPCFLMAMLLKQHLKAIKAVTGKKPKQIGLCLLEKDASSNNQRFKDQLVESCKLLKISCRFVNV